MRVDIRPVKDDVEAIVQLMRATRRAICREELDPGEVVVEIIGSRRDFDHMIDTIASSERLYEISPAFRKPCQTFELCGVKLRRPQDG